MSKIMKYKVKVEKVNKKTSIAKKEDAEIILGTKKGDSFEMFNAAEILLSAFGACLITNINSFSNKMRLMIKDVMINITGIRVDNPPMIKEIICKINIESDENHSSIEKLIELSLKYGTVTNTLLKGTKIKKEILLNSKEQKLEFLN